MIFEYIRHAYHNAFRYPVRFLSMVSGIALATFCILYLVSAVDSQYDNNRYAIRSITEQNLNYTQFTLSTKTVNRPVTGETLEQAAALQGVKKGYYYEDMSFYLWQYEYLAPWIEWENKLLIEMQPIMVDVTGAQEYGLEDKVIYGRYFSDDPHEMMISADLFNHFVQKNAVIQSNTSIITEEHRASIKKGNGTPVDPQSLVGQVVPFMYAIDFGEDIRQIKELHSVPLKVVGVFDPGIGYETQGNVWLPLSLKSSLPKLDLTSLATGASGKLAITIENDSYSGKLTGYAEKAGYFVSRSFQLSAADKSTLSGLKMQQPFYSYSLIIAVIISLIGFIVICFLVISGRKYELLLQRALGLTKSKTILLFSLEICIISIIGTMLGLVIVLALINGGSKWLFHSNYYLPGDITLLVVGGLPILATGISYVMIVYSSRTPISIGLARGE
jgi:hypothetical protein